MRIGGLEQQLNGWSRHKPAAAELTRVRRKRIHEFFSGGSLTVSFPHLVCATSIDSSFLFLQNKHFPEPVPMHT